MSNKKGRAAVAVIAGALVGTLAAGQQVQEITVNASRAIQKTVGRDRANERIVNLALSYDVSYAGLDLTKHTDVLELEKRVNDTALKACKELNRQYPIDAQPEDDCAKAAATKPLVKVHELAVSAGHPAAN